MCDLLLYGVKILLFAPTDEIWSLPFCQGWLWAICVNLKFVVSICQKTPGYYKVNNSVPVQIPAPGDNEYNLLVKLPPPLVFLYHLSF